MNVQIDRAVKLTRGYWFVDGFTEMTSGSFFVLLAGLLLFGRNASPVTFPSWFLSLAVEISILKFVGILAAILILWWLKDHFTYPRTGFVRGKRVTAAQIFMITRNVILFLLLPISGLLAASLFIASTNSVLASMPVWFPIGLGSLWAVFFALAGEWMSLLRFRIIGIIHLLVGAAIGIWQSAIGLPTSPAKIQPGIVQAPILESIQRTLISLCFLILISGVILIFSGLLTFLRYRKENPVPYTENG